MQTTSVNIYLFGLTDVQVQGSDQEIREGLEKLGAIEVHGHWMCVKMTAIEQGLSIIGDTLVLNDWKPESIDPEALATAVGEALAGSILQYCLEQFCRSLSSNAGADRRIKLDEAKVCAFYGELILRREAGGQWLPWEDFLPWWKKAIPEVFSMTVDKAMLSQIAIDERDKTGRAGIRLFAAKDLPSDLSRRMVTLFDTRESWTRDELLPYFGSYLDDALTSYAKAVRLLTANGSITIQYRRKAIARAVKA